MRISGKTAVVTGAGRAIGRACALRLAAEGADLVLVDVGGDLPGVPYRLSSRAQLDGVAGECRAAGAAVEVVFGDVRDNGTADAAVACAVDRFGRIDALVANAGIAAPSGRPAHEVSDDDWQIMLDVNLTAGFKMLRAAVPSMMEQRSGSIVMVASTAGLVGYRHFAGYVASKHGLIGLTRAAALDYAPYNIRVNAVCPGSVRDDPDLDGRMLAEIARSLRIDESTYEQTFGQAQPGNALVEATGVAGAILWLVSDDAVHVTGSVTTVDGGFTAR